MDSKTIKFRVFNKAVQRWFYYKIPEDPDRDWNLRFNEDFDWSTLGRFTDQLDKFKKEIYQGDLIRFQLREIEGKVVYSQGEFLVTADENYWFYLKSIMDYEPEVFGNIHQESGVQGFLSSLIKK